MDKIEANGLWKWLTPYLTISINGCRMLGEHRTLNDINVRHNLLLRKTYTSNVLQLKMC